MLRMPGSTINSITLPEESTMLGYVQGRPHNNDQCSPLWQISDDFLNIRLPNSQLTNCIQYRII